MINAQFDPTQLKDTIDALQELSKDAWITRSLRSKRSELGEIGKRQFDRVTATTQYSTSYLGRLKPSRQRRAGGAGDKGYGRDTDALYTDLITPDISRDMVSYGSDLIYSSYQEQLLNYKAQQGEAQESSFFAEDGEYLGLVEDVVGDAVEEIWGG